MTSTAKRQKKQDPSTPSPSGVVSRRQSRGFGKLA